MSNLAPPLASSGPLSRLAVRALPLLALALTAAAGAAAAGPGVVRTGLIAVATTLALTAAVLRAGALAARLRRRSFARHLRRIVADDAAPCLATDRDGQVIYRNRAAEARFDRADRPTLAATLADVFAHPAAVLYRLQSRADRAGAAREDVVTRRGHIRLSVHRVEDGLFLWRLEEIADRAGPGAARGAEGLSLPMLVAARTGTILFVNEAMRRLVGGRPRTLDRVFADPGVRSGDTLVVAGPDGPVRAQMVEIAAAGDRREIYLLPAPDTAPAPATAEEDLPVAVVRLAATGAIRGANRRARELLDLAPGALPALPDLLDGPGRPLRDWLADIAAGTLPPRPEVMRLRAPAEDRFVQVVPQRDPDGALSVVLTDATALKTLEAQFVQGQKMQAIGQLAGGVAHDFNNLLTAISGHCDLLLLRRDPTDPDYADLMQIHENANRAGALVSQLLAFSRKQPMRAERIDVPDVLADVTHLLRRLVGERVTLDLVPPDDLPPIRADRRQLEQVLMNLVVNARDAMPAGGPVRIATDLRRLDQPLPRGHVTVPPGDYVIVTVSDQGTGIPPELHDRIFEPFYTTKRPGEGTGLGLSTVYGIVKQSGGFVFVDSVEGEGSTFSLWFPAWRAAAEAEAPRPAGVGAPRSSPAPDAAQPPADVAGAGTADAVALPPAPLADLVPSAPTDRDAPADRPRPRAGVVLLVEDEAAVRAFASRALRLRGHKVIEADSAEQALRALEDPDIAVDVFVTDVMMPGMDGPTWVRRALERRPGVRVVFVSGYAEDAIPEGDREIPHAVFLAKPFSLEDLTATVQRQLH